MMWGQSHANADTHSPTSGLYARTAVPMSAVLSKKILMTHPGGANLANSLGHMLARTDLETPAGHEHKQDPRNPTMAQTRSSNHP